MELRHSLRSIAQHWQGEYDEIYILGAWMPEWINKETVKFKLAPQYVQALYAAVELAGTKGHILWMNDDILLMQDTTWDDLVLPARRENARLVSKDSAEAWTRSDNGWVRRLGQIMLDLHSKGLTTWKFSTHTPYYYESDLLKPILDDYAELGYKVAVENAYFNQYIDRFGEAQCVDKFRAGGNNCRIPMERIEDIRFLNLVPNIKPWLRGFIRGRWPYRCQFETPEMKG